MAKVCTIKISLDGDKLAINRTDEGYPEGESNLASNLGTICMMVCAVGGQRGFESLAPTVMQLDRISRNG